MKVLPDYLGVVSVGVKAGVILPGDDIVRTVCERIEECDGDGLVDDGDIVCVTESVVARSQNNYVTEEEIAEEVRTRLGVRSSGHLGVLFPILSRNRFAAVLRGIAKAVPEGKVTIQLSYPSDEVGNQTIPEEYLSECGLGPGEELTLEDIGGRRFHHPLTGVDYVGFYREIVEETGAEAGFLFCNDPLAIVSRKPDGIIISDIHGRRKTEAAVEREFGNCITLQDVYNDDRREAWSEWGLLGSNLSSRGRIKLAPREGDRVAAEIQRAVLSCTGKKVEVIIYGDGAYKDPSSGIYELVDPGTHFGMTDGLRNLKRTGVKYKWLADTLMEEGRSREEIERRIDDAKRRRHEVDSPLMEGTTPRRLADVVASLADLVSGSADAGTPIVLVKGILSKQIES